MVLWSLMVVLPLAALPLLPEQIAIHWNLRGEADSWVARWPGVLLYLTLPAFMVFFWLVFRVVWRRAGADADHPATVRRALGRIFTGLLVLMLLLEATFVAQSAGWPVPGGRIAVALMGLGFAAMGPLMPDLPPNPWIGVRTPWTLEDARVWEMTHRLAARVFPSGGLVAAAAAVLPRPYHVATFLGIIVAVALVLAAYSYGIRSGS